MQVYQMYKDMMYNVSYRIIKNRQDAQDAVHDAFIKAFRNIVKTENDLKLGPWLKRIVINCSLDVLRQRQKMGWLHESFDIKEPEAEEDTQEDLTWQVEAIKKGIQQLKDKYRIIMVLYLIEGYSHREIAEQLDLNPSTVRNQYIRGKRLLLSQLQAKSSL